MGDEESPPAKLSHRRKSIQACMVEPSSVAYTLSFAAFASGSREEGRLVEDKTRWRALLLFGVPGSGKGTQGRAIGCLPGFLHVSSGDIFRTLYTTGPLGKEVHRFTSAGELVPDELTVQIWNNHMSLLERDGHFDPHSQVILCDGIPRTFHQAQMLHERIDVLRIFYLKLHDEDEAVERIRRRALKEGRTDDADESVIRGRFETFHQQTADTLRFYDESLITEINASECAVHVLSELAREIALAVNESQVAPTTRG